MYVYTCAHTHIHACACTQTNKSASYISDSDSHFLRTLNITKAIVRQRTLTVIKVIVRQENMLFLSSTPLFYPRKILNSSELILRPMSSHCSTGRFLSGF